MGAETDTRTIDPGGLLIGGWFAVVGVLAMIAGADSTTDALPLLFPITLALVGIGVLLPPRRRASRAQADEDDEHDRAPEIPDEYFA